MTAIDQWGGWPAILTDLLEGRDLPAEQARGAMATILAGEATAAQLIGFVVALRAKGETPEEISALLDAVLDACTLVPLDESLRNRAVDVVGTGGDRSHSINVSTMAAIVTAGAGVPVCKHGARAASSKCGTADVLEALGVAVELSPEGVRRCVEEAGIGFCLAPRYHPAFRFAAPSRREIGIPTVFNLLGPMANPAPVSNMLVGVAFPAVMDKMAAALQSRGVTSAWVVHGHGGLDELAVSGPNTVFALRDGQVEKFEIDAKDHGIARSGIEDVRGGEVAENLAALRSLLEGKKGPVRDIVVFNAACAMHVAGLVSDIADGIDRACASIDSGAARDVLDRTVEVSRRAAARAGQ